MKLAVLLLVLLVPVSAVAILARQAVQFGCLRFNQNFQVVGRLLLSDNFLKRVGFVSAELVD